MRLKQLSPPPFAMLSELPEEPDFATNDEREQDPPCKLATVNGIEAGQQPLNSFLHKGFFL